MLEGKFGLKVEKWHITCIKTEKLIWSKWNEAQNFEK